MYHTLTQFSFAKRHMNNYKPSYSSKLFITKTIFTIFICTITGFMQGLSNFVEAIGRKLCTLYLWRQLVAGATSACGYCLPRQAPGCFQPWLYQACRHSPVVSSMLNGGRGGDWMGHTSASPPLPTQCTMHTGTWVQVPEPYLWLCKCRLLCCSAVHWCPRL